MSVTNQSLNNNIVLTNAFCCISKLAAKVSKLLSIGNRCSKKEVQKLKLLVDYVEVFKCSSSVNSKFSFILLLTSPPIFAIKSSIFLTYYITYNGITVTKQGDGFSTELQIMLKLFEETGKFIAYIPQDVSPDYIFAVEMTCDVKTLVTGIINGGSISVVNFDLIQSGKCITDSCLSEDNFNIIKSKIMDICDICECQLTQ